MLQHGLNLTSKGAEPPLGLGAQPPKPEGGPKKKLKYP